MDLASPAVSGTSVYANGLTTFKKITAVYCKKIYEIHEYILWQNAVYLNVKTNSHRKIQQVATVYQNLLFHIYIKLNMFRVTQRPSSGA